MLTKRQNLIETIRGGNPDRYVNQFEPYAIIPNPFSVANRNPKMGEENVVNLWGVTKSWPAGTPGPFPIHDAAHIVCPDITEWRKTVHAPNVVFSDEEWAPYVEMAEKVDRNEYFVTHYVAPGIFEQCHSATISRRSRTASSTSTRSPRLCTSSSITSPSGN